MDRQRMVTTIVSLTLVIMFFVLIIYFRHKASIRLETAYYQLEIANEKTMITTPDIKLDEETRQDMNQKSWKTLSALPNW